MTEGEPVVVHSRKRARFAEESNEVTVFHSTNPVTHVRALEEMDPKVLNARDIQQDIQTKLRNQQLSAVLPRSCSTPSSSELSSPRPTSLPTPADVPQQAFHIFQIPVVLDSKLLTRSELQAELRIRGLRVSGPKDQLVKRLDYYIREKEPLRVLE